MVEMDSNLHAGIAGAGTVICAGLLRAGGGRLLRWMQRHDYDIALKRGIDGFFLWPWRTLRRLLQRLRGGGRPDAGQPGGGSKTADGVGEEMRWRGPWSP